MIVKFYIVKQTTNNFQLKKLHVCVKKNYIILVIHYR